MKNYLLKALAYDKQVRIYVVRCDNVLNNLAKRLNNFLSWNDGQGYIIQVHLHPLVALWHLLQ